MPRIADATVQLSNAAVLAVSILLRHDQIGRCDNLLYFRLEETRPLPSMKPILHDIESLSVEWAIEVVWFDFPADVDGKEGVDTTRDAAEVGYLPTFSGRHR